MSNSFAIRSGLRLVLGAGFGLLLAQSALAQVLDRSIQTEEQIARSAAQVQAQINQVADETDSLVNEYRVVLGKIESLRVYNEMLQDTVDSQEREIENINTQLVNLEQTNRDVVPLMIEMADTLPQLVQADIPFRVDERQARAEMLIDALDRADVTTSEKFRRILEAYTSEIELGRTTEGYRGQLPDGQRVDFLRIGRTLLFYNLWMAAKPVGGIRIRARSSSWATSTAWPYLTVLRLRRTRSPLTSSVFPCPLRPRLNNEKVHDFCNDHCNDRLAGISDGRYWPRNRPTSTDASGSAAPG